MKFMSHSFLRKKINNLKDLKNFSNDLKNLERKITMFHVKVVSEISKTRNRFNRFSWQTIYHNSEEKFLFNLVMEILSKLTHKMLFIISEKKIL